MDRRRFVQAGIGTALTSMAPQFDPRPVKSASSDIRSQFPRLSNEVYLNAAGLMPLSTFSEEALNKYAAFQQLGSEEGRGEFVGEMQTNVRRVFGNLIGALESEIGLVHCTKAGEQIVLDALPEDGNVVTNDLHFSGSLHNLIGLSRAGRDLKIVKARDWKIDSDEMIAAIDKDTVLVTVSLVSNINGHVEDIRAVADAAHTHGAIVFADIIQAAGSVPLNVHNLGIDVASCSCYKWLYGVHGSGFVYVKQDLQGTRIADRLFPGHVGHNYFPWIEKAESTNDDYTVALREDATRYQPGHVNYMGYCAAYEGLKFLQQHGVENVLAHSVALNKRLLSKVDRDRHQFITPDVERSPIATFVVDDREEVLRRLLDSKIVTSLSGRRMRVSPGVYNNEDDIDQLASILDY